MAEKFKLVYIPITRFPNSCFRQVNPVWTQRSFCISNTQGYPSVLSQNSMHHKHKLVDFKWILKTQYGPSTKIFSIYCRQTFATAFGWFVNHVHITTACQLTCVSHRFHKFLSLQLERHLVGKFFKKTLNKVNFWVSTLLESSVYENF